MKNLVLDKPVDEHLKPVKDSDGTSTSIELSTDKIRVKDLEVTGSTTGIETGTSITVDSSLTDGSTNPVENNAVYDGLATKLNLSGGTVTGAVHMDDDVKIEFGDAEEYIKGDGSKLYISSTNWINFTDSRIEGINRIVFPSATMDNFIDEDDMATNSDTSAPSQQSVKAYVDASSKFFLTSAFYHGGTNLEYIPIAGGSTFEQSSLTDYGNDDTTFIVPYNLKINTIYVCATRASNTANIAGNTNVRLHKNYSALSGNVTVNMSTIGYDSTDLATVYTFDFSGETNTYSAGDIMQISIDPTSTLYYVSITIVGLYT